MSSNHTSIPDSKELEQMLRGLSPASLNADFLDRLEDAADGSLLALTATEIQFERSLRAHRPRTLQPEYLERLEAVVADMPFSRDEKIVLFPKTAPLVRKAGASRGRPMWAAAAAVAIIGGATALLMPGGRSSTGIASGNGSPISSQVVPAGNSNYVAAGFNRGLGEVKDEGFTWGGSGDKTHRVVKVTYLDRITLRNKEGKTVEVEQPRTEYILVPEKVD